MSAHADPVFYERFEFCRVDCVECSRLDAEDTREKHVQIIDGLNRVTNAVNNGGFDIPMPERP